MQLASYKKYIMTGGLVLGLVVILAATIFLGSRASSFLAKASSCDATNVSVKQVTANGAIISWETSEVSQGRVEYGTNAASLTFSAPEASSGKAHNVPLTLLTPNTIYYYLINIGDKRCDSGGKACADNCIPYSFTTTAITPQPELTKAIPTNTPTPQASPISRPEEPSPTKKSSAATPTLLPSPTSVRAGVATPTASTSSSISCESVKSNLGENTESDNWDDIKKYDLDGNGIINGIDIIKCQQM